MANAATLRCLTNMDIYSLVFIYLKHEALEYACVRVRMRCMRWLIVVGAINKVWHEHQGLLFSSGEAGWTCFHSRPQRIFLYKNISKARRSDCGDYYFFIIICYLQAMFPLWWMQIHIKTRKWNPVPARCFVIWKKQNKN